MHNEQQAIRWRAYSIWEREGCPDGREQEHWLLAEREIAIEQSGPGVAVESAVDAAPSKAPRRGRQAAKAGTSRAAGGAARAARAKKSSRKVTEQS